MKQIPLGPTDLNCHRCLPKAVPMSKVCHKCSLWMSMRGRNPNTGQEIDEWGCADRWKIVVQLETAQLTRSNAAATESFRNEVATANVVALNAVFRVPTWAEAQPRNLIGHNDHRALDLLPSDVEAAE